MKGRVVTELAFRVTGEGPAILLIHGGGEDLAMITPVAEAIAAHRHRVVWYDRRGTGGSTRAHWPRDGAPQHAEDAAALLAEVVGEPATVVGFSSGGAVALALAERHPERLRHVIAWEPAALGVLPYAEDLYPSMNGPYERYLEEHPGDWVGGYHVVLDTLSEGRADHEAPVVKQSERNAEAMLRDDGPLVVRYRPDTRRIPAGLVTLAVTEGVLPLHRDIADRLGAELGHPPVVLTGAREHEDYLLAPERSADLIVAMIGQTVPVS